MGKSAGLYVSEFPQGTRVRVAGLKLLEDFRRSWRFHNPLQAEQLAFAGRKTTIKTVAFYHGGDELYLLSGIPGLWHEACLESDADCE